MQTQDEASTGPSNLFHLVVRSMPQMQFQMRQLAGVLTDVFLLPAASQVATEIKAEMATFMPEAGRRRDEADSRSVKVSQDFEVDF